MADGASTAVPYRISRHRFASFVLGLAVAAVHLGGAYAPNQYVMEGDQRYSRLDRAAEAVLDPLQTLSKQAVHEALRQGERDAWNWLVVAAHFDADDRDDLAYLAKEMAYLQSGGDLEQWTSLLGGNEDRRAAPPGNRGA